MSIKRAVPNYHPVASSTPKFKESNGELGNILPAPRPKSPALRARLTWDACIRAWFKQASILAGSIELIAYVRLGPSSTSISHLSSRQRTTFVCLVPHRIAANLPSPASIPKTDLETHDRACAHHSCRPPSHLCSTAHIALETMTMVRGRISLSQCIHAYIALVILIPLVSAQTYYFTGAVTVQQAGGGYSPAQQAVCPHGYENRCDDIGASD